MKKEKNICDIIFNHVKKPSEYLMCRSMNVFDDKYRVNIYTKRYVEGIEGKQIKHSYFCRFNDESGNLTIISGA